MALPKGQALHYIFFCHIWQQKKDAISILNASQNTMKAFIYKYYTIIITIAIVVSLASIYVINTYKTGFLGGFISGLFSALAFGLLVTPRHKFLK